ncbi:methylmalonyl-CoA mutase family protein [Luteibaculum oceani]|uniref:Methylmalonyl-CoA mutase alpha/beta chain catalytic domain-containing protein n=1 Tax=Luteibaculum oceani TaxID=1294296 RepID=A0A5C6V4C3_9FLAO|nr:methylmalonyl-CoA mutase family protein [Luteibaculum oceani]TXC78568.1 hypothetical protein FRX97_07575 [Luteibaculum oceani]
MGLNSAVEDFPNFPKSMWRAKVEKELKGKKFEDHLISHFVSAPAIDAYQTAEDIEKLTIDPKLVQSAVQFFASQSTQKGYEIFIDKEEDANKKALVVLQQGVSYLQFKSSKDCIDWNKVFKDIDTGLLQISVDCHPKNILACIDEMPLNSGCKLQIDLSPFHSSFNLKKLSEEFTEAQEIARNKGIILRYLFDFNGLAGTGCNFELQLAAMSLFFKDWVAIAEKSSERENLINGVQFSYAANPELFAEIAKHRALCCLFSKTLQESNLDLTKIFPGGFLIAYNQLFRGTNDEEVNLIRLSSFAFGAFACNPEAVVLCDFKTEEKNFIPRVSANVATILEEESKLGHYVDPTAGSYYVEKLTQELVFGAIEKSRSFVYYDWHQFAHSKNFVSEVDLCSTQLRTLFETKELEMIGENLYPPAGKEAYTILETLKLK